MRQILLFLFFLPLITIGQTIEIDTVYSTNTKDKYVITVRKPGGFSASKKYHHVKMTDWWLWDWG